MPGFAVECPDLILTDFPRHGNNELQLRSLLRRSETAQATHPPAGKEGIALPDDLAQPGPSRFPFGRGSTDRIDGRYITRWQSEQIGDLNVIATQQIGNNLKMPPRTRTAAERRVE